MAPREKDNCFNCRFFLSFTPNEKEYVEKRLEAHGYRRPVWGGCTALDGATLKLVRRYISAPVKDCQFWEMGRFQERIHRSCPQCRTGEVVIRRAFRNHKNFSFIGCSKYPDCEFSTRFLPLDRRCKYCDVPLVLSTGNELRCTCPQCKRSVQLPLMLHSWPALTTGDHGHLDHAPSMDIDFSNSNSLCVHGRKIDACDACLSSMNRRINLIDLELPEVAAFWVRRDDEKLSYKRGVDALKFSELESYDDIPWSMEAEEEEEAWRERSEWSESFARSDDEGWYYSE